MDLTVATEQTLDAIKKATAGVNSSTGIFGIDLSDLISLIPVNTPFRDKLARTSPKMGAPYAQWRVLTDVTNSQPDPSTPFDYAAPLVNLNEMDVSARYKKIGAGYTVTQDAIDLAEGYADAKAIAVMNALNQWKIGEDKKAIGGTNVTLGTPAQPVVTTSTTGGSIGATLAVNVKVAARSATNYFWGGSTIASTQGTVTTGAGSTNSATATVTAVRGAVAYDWYVAGFYYTTTTVNTVLITSIPGANQALPTLPDLWATAPTSVPVADASFNANDYNGLLSTLSSDYATGGAVGLVQAGSGVSSGAYFASLNGAAFTNSGQSIVELDNMFQSIFDKVRLSPDALMVSSQEGTKISRLLLANGVANTFYTPGADGRLDSYASGFVGHYVNKAAGGVPVNIEVHPHMPPGTIVARTDRVPFPNSNITNVTEIRCLRDVADYEYATNRVASTAGGGPRFDGETYANEVFINRAPVAMGVLQNIG